MDPFFTSRFLKASPPLLLEPASVLFERLCLSHSTEPLHRSSRIALARSAGRLFRGITTCPFSAAFSPGPRRLLWHANRSALLAGETRHGVSFSGTLVQVSADDAVIYAIMLSGLTIACRSISTIISFQIVSSLGGCIAGFIAAPFIPRL